MDGQRDHNCDRCGGVDRFILHNVRFEAKLRRFCTSCVLQTFPGSFCAVCFGIFETLPPPAERAMCLSCQSVSHLSCCINSDADLYLVSQCPRCRNPRLNFFEVKGDVDLASAKKIYAAAWIASESMKKAAIAAREEAVRKTRDAILARRNAKEALERLSTIRIRVNGD